VKSRDSPQPAFHRTYYRTEHKIARTSEGAQSKHRASGKAHRDSQSPAFRGSAAIEDDHRDAWPQCRGPWLTAPAPAPGVRQGSRARTIPAPSIRPALRD